MPAPTTSKEFHKSRLKTDVLEKLAEFYCLTPKLLATIQRDRTPNENDIRTINRTLNLLRAEGRLHRLRYFDPLEERGATTYVYGLKKADRSFGDHALRTLDHELEISHFHAHIKKLCEAKNWKLTWIQDGIDYDRTINPDAFFAITKPELPENKNTFPFFLEIERARFGNYRTGKPSIIRKLEKYRDYFDSEQCQKEWGFRKFRVAVVQPTATRREHLLDLMHGALTHRAFWLTTEPLYKESLGGKIWKTPKDGAVSLLDI